MKAVHSLLVSACLVTSALAAPLAAQAQEKLCGDSYVIKPGDTLSGLAERVFGDQARFLNFYNDPRNEATLGKNPNQINVGAQVYLPPCDDDVTPLPAAATGADKPAAADLFALPIDIVTGSPYAPFTDEGMEDGGMLTRVVRDAFAHSGSTQEVQIDFINDWGAMLETLLPKAKYNFSFPWFKPDCDAPGPKSENTKIRCELLWSDPVFSVIVGYYAPVGIANPPQSIEEMKGMRLCRPEGYFTFDLDQAGLIAGETIELVQPVAVRDCFTALENGEVDFVSLNRFTAEKAIAKAGLTGLVKPLSSVVSSMDLHLVAHPYDGDAVRYMQTFNKGLREIKRSGLYGRITNHFLKIHDREVDEIAASASN